MNQDNEALEFLIKDPVMAELAKRHGIPTWPNESTDLLTDIIDSIISQQLSSKAAATIFKRFQALLPDAVVTPKAVLAIPDEKMRACGISNAKVSYIKGICQSVLDRTLNLEKLREMSDDEVLVELVKQRGIGPWTAQMIMMFTLRRPDIFSVGDLGLRTAVAKLYQVDRDNLKKIEEISFSWKPHRTIASRLLWKSLGES